MCSWCMSDLQLYTSAVEHSHDLGARDSHLVTVPQADFVMLMHLSSFSLFSKGHMKWWRRKCVNCASLLHWSATSRSLTSYITCTLCWTEGADTKTLPPRDLHICSNNLQLSDKLLQALTLVVDHVGSDVIKSCELSISLNIFYVLIPTYISLISSEVDWRIRKFNLCFERYFIAHAVTLQKHLLSYLLCSLVYQIRCCSRANKNTSVLYLFVWWKTIEWYYEGYWTVMLNTSHFHSLVEASEAEGYQPRYWWIC